MSKAPGGVVIAKSRAKYNEGYMPGFCNYFEAEAEEGGTANRAEPAPARTLYRAAYFKRAGVVVPDVYHLSGRRGSDRSGLRHSYLCRCQEHGH
jgi:hypothetical protein